MEGGRRDCGAAGRDPGGRGAKASPSKGARTSLATMAASLSPAGGAAAGAEPGTTRNCSFFPPTAADFR